jgi:CheY-like chemotaxis protein
MKPFSLFVVEDEESVRRGIALALEGKYAVRTFGDGESAVEAARETAGPRPHGYRAARYEGIEASSDA